MIAIDLFDAPVSLDDWYLAERAAAFFDAGFARVTHWTSSSKRQPRRLSVYEIDGDAPALLPLLPGHEGLDVKSCGVFGPTGSLSTPRREGVAGGLLVGLTDCEGASSEADFERFYDDVHAREVLASGLYLGARRFRSVDPTPSHPRFVALYESEGEGPATFRAFLAAVTPTPMPPCFLFRSAMTFSLLG